VKIRKSAPYKILYLDSVSAIGGAERSLLLLLQNINRQHFKPMVVLPERGPLSERIQALGVELKLLPLNKINVRNPLPYMKTVWSLRKILLTRRIDLLHCNTGICNQYGMITAKLVGLPVVTHTRNILGKRAFQRMFLGRADVLIANSRAVADSYAQYVSKDQGVEII
jgi:UDP-N-acetylglucosamine:LPS N-acetylglucosamine transferase